MFGKKEDVKELNSIEFVMKIFFNEDTNPVQVRELVYQSLYEAKQRLPTLYAIEIKEVTTLFKRIS